jgi:hypothetical protein
LRKSSEIYQSNNSESIIRVKDPVTHDKLDIIATYLGSGIHISEYSGEQAVPNGDLAEIFSYTVPVGKNLSLNFIHCSGQNVAEYFVYIDAIANGVGRTYFGSSLDCKIEYGSLIVSSGSVITVELNNYRPSVANFSVRLVGVLANA